MQVNTANHVMSDVRTCEIPSSDLHLALKAVSLAASTDPERPHLRAVHFEATDQLAITATDGHWVAQWTCEPAQCPSLPSSMLVSLHDVKRLLPLLAADAKMVNQCTLNFGAGTVEFTDGTMVQLSLVSESPPPYNTLWPTSEPTGVPVIGVGAKLATKAMKAFASANSDASVWMQFRGPLDVILMGSDGVPELRCLVMPVRLKEEVD